MTIQQQTMISVSADVSREKLSSLTFIRLTVTTKATRVVKYDQSRRTKVIRVLPVRHLLIKEDQETKKKERKMWVFGNILRKLRCQTFIYVLCARNARARMEIQLTCGIIFRGFTKQNTIH